MPLRLPPVAFCAILLTIFPVVPAVACKYSVRDVAFVELAPELYHLEFAYGAGVPERHLAWASAASSQLLDSNARFTEPNGRKSAEDILMYLRSPEGRSLTLLDAHYARIDEDAVWSAFREVVSSPARDEIFAHILTSHSIVLVVQGEDAAVNRRAAEMAAGAVREIAAGMDQLPKPAGGPPRVITLPYDQRTAERVLLFSLGVEADHREDAHVVLLIGRGRKLGPVLTVPGTTQLEIATHLSYVGADCECELDRSWMQGTMVPHVWNERHEAAALAALGFDPGSALIKSEIHRILLRGPGGGAAGEFHPEVGDPLLGYSEIEIMPEPPVIQARPDPPPSEERRIVSEQQPPPVPPRSSDEPEPFRAAGIAVLLWFVGGIVLLSILCGAALVALRAGRSS